MTDTTYMNWANIDLAENAVLYIEELSRRARRTGSNEINALVLTIRDSANQSYTRNREVTVTMGLLNDIQQALTYAGKECQLPPDAQAELDSILAR